MRLSGWLPLLWLPLRPLLERRRARCAAALDGQWRRVACMPALLDPVWNTSVELMPVALSLVHVLALHRALTPSLLTAQWAHWVQLAVLHRRILEKRICLLRRHHDG